MKLFVFLGKLELSVQQVVDQLCEPRLGELGTHGNGAVLVHVSYCPELVETGASG